MADDDTKQKEAEAKADAKAAKAQEKAHEAKKAKEDEAEKKDKKAPQPKKGDYGPDFKYIVRLAATDLDGTKAVRVALTSIKGVGDRVARVVAAKAEVDPNELIGNMTDPQVETLQKTINEAGKTLPGWAVNRPLDYETGQNLHVVGPEVDARLRDDLNRMKKIRSYKGIRHEAGLRVRGQRTRANGRTGLTIGVQRTKAQADAAEKKKEES
jgi:small subunit ribosomal protein S13